MRERLFLEHDIVMTCRLPTRPRSMRMGGPECISRRGSVAGKHRIHLLANWGELCVDDVT